MTYTLQEIWADQLRSIPDTFYNALQIDNEQVIRHRPAPGEWSALEVMGHMIDKMQHWSRRVERILSEDRSILSVYDQDAEVREHAYQNADPATLREQLQQACEHFASLVAPLPSSTLQREGTHADYGSITLSQCIELPLASVPEHLEQLRSAQNIL
jgi:hypothetical protein